MASAFATFTFRIRSRTTIPPPNIKRSRRAYRSSASTSTNTVVNTSGAKIGPTTNDAVAPLASTTSPLARLSTKSIVRCLFLSTFFTSPFLFRPGFAVFQKIANSQSVWLNPDRNPLLRALIRPLIYDQFCAGRNEAEIHQTASEIKRLGFSGVVLCYGKEVQLTGDKFLGYDESKTAAMDAEIEQWKTGNLETLNMVGEGDWLGIKYTGAGLHITNALMQGESPPQTFIDAMEAICDRALARGCRIWIDAEQQILQGTIDKWTFEFMRRFNHAGQQALIYNTIQAYLKCSRDKVQHQLELSRREGWRLGIKLVRGAYISNDMRDKIHDTKADTDASYNGIVHDLLCGNNFPAFAAHSQKTSEFDLLLAGHNTDTIRNAAGLASKLAAESKLHVRPEFAQLQGMADDVGCRLLQIADDVKKDKSGLLPSQRFIPKVYKCLTWGSIQECMQYLTRRLVENRGAADRMTAGAAEMRKELRRRSIAGS